MGCGCKKDMSVSNSTSTSSTITFSDIVTYGLKFLGFLLVVAMLPIINLIIIWFIFRTLVLNKEVSMKPLLMSLVNKFKDNSEEEEEEINEDDVEYEMSDVEVIR